VEESTAGHTKCKWSLLKVKERNYKRGHGGKVREGNYKRRLGGIKWNLEAESFSFPGAFQTYANIWKGKNLVISNQ
jgi:hypothetical protein